MKLNNQVPLQRLVGKIDNDFNISESDWIPRVAAWTIDALSQMKVLPMERKRRRLEVSDRIATFPCELNASEIKVFDKNGCEIEHLDKSKSSCNCSASRATSLQRLNLGKSLARFHRLHQTQLLASFNITPYQDLNKLNKLYYLSSIVCITD